MRGLFLLLLLTNMAALVWQFTLHEGGAGAARTPGMAPSTGEGLTLLSELAQEQQPALRDGADVEVEAVEMQHEEPRETSSTGRGVAGTHEGVLEDKEDAKDTAGAVCLSVEGIDSETAVKQLLRAVEKSGAVLLEQGEKQGTNTNYWVMLPPYPNRAKADEAAAMLDGKSVKDFFIVRSGEYENAVSLGVFSGPDRARSRAEQIVALKLRLRKPKIETIKLPAKQYFVRFKVEDTVKADSAVTLLEELDYPPARKVICR